MKRIIYLLLLLPLFADAQSVHITTPSDTICSGSLITFKATYSGITAPPHYHWQVNAVASGTDSFGFSTRLLTDPDTIVCTLTNSAGDTTFATSYRIITIQHMLVASGITGPDSIVCVGATITLSDSTSGGKWSASNGYATDSSGIITGISIAYEFEYHLEPSTDTIFYSISNSCGSDTAFKKITINAIPNAYFDLYPSLCVNQQESLVDGNGDFENFYSTTGNVGIGWNYIYGNNPGGDYLVNIVSNYCGSDTFGQSMGVMPGPTLTALSAPVSTLCVGDSTTLTGSFSGSPFWKTSNTNAMVSANGVVKGVNPGFVNITLSVSNNCGSASKTITINILPPGAIMGFDSMCIGGSTTYSDTSKGGAWTSSNSGIITIDQSGTVTALTNGMAVICYEYDNCTVSKQLIINSAPPPITGPDSLCNGATSVYTDFIKGGRWKTTDTTVASIGSITGILHAINPGIDTLLYDLSLGCISKTRVFVNPPGGNISGATMICTNSTITLSAYGSGEWSTDNTIIATVDRTNGKISGVSSGYAIITYSYISGCIDTTMVPVTNCDIHANIFPNPSKYELVIHADTNFYYNFTILNILGQIIMRQYIYADLTTINVQALPTGIYFINLYGYDGKTVLKFIKE